MKLVDLFKWNTRQPRVDSDLLIFLPTEECGEREHQQDQKGIRQMDGQQTHL